MRISKLKLGAYLILCLQITNIQAQIHTLVETKGSVSSGQSPFWMTNNQQGLYSLEKSNGYLRAGIFREMKDTASQWDYRFGLDVVEAGNYPSSFVVQQLYGDIRYKKVILSIGSKERWGILKNAALSSGGMAWSGNARPIPQVRLETDGFVSFPWLLHNQLKVNAALSYGCFTDEAYIKNKLGSSTNNVLYHDKSLILQYDSPHSRWSTTLGLESYGQFGGERKDLKQFFMIFVQSQGDSNSPEYDKLYMFGSSRGSWHIRPTYHGNGYDLSSYLENYFDDFSGMAKQNKMDGLWGLEYKRTDHQTGITGIVLEYLQTTDQSGPNNWVLHDHVGTQLIVESPKGGDNYYGGVYNGGWTHWSMVNGNPLLSSPIYGPNGVTGIFNNRVKAYHLGISAQITPAISTRLLGTYTRGWGSYGRPFDDITKDYLSMMEVSYTTGKCRQWQFSVTGAMDRGDLYGDNSGVSLKIRHQR